MSFARVNRVRVWSGFVRSALLLAVVACIVLSFEAMPGLCCFLRVPHLNISLTPEASVEHPRFPRSRASLVHFLETGVKSKARQLGVGCALLEALYHMNCLSFVFLSGARRLEFPPCNT